MTWKDSDEDDDAAFENFLTDALTATTRMAELKRQLLTQNRLLKKIGTFMSKADSFNNRCIPSKRLLIRVYNNKFLSRLVFGSTLLTCMQARTCKLKILANLAYIGTHLTNYDPFRCFYPSFDTLSPK